MIEQPDSSGSIGKECDLVLMAGHTEIKGRFGDEYHRCPIGCIASARNENPDRAITTTERNLANS